MRLPNLLVIGAQKAGTTWLHKRLSEHPQVLMSRSKEPNLFGDPDYATKLDEYRALFPVRRGKLYYGESTPGYFWTWDPDSAWCDRYHNRNRDIPGSVFRTLGADTRLIISLRHPVDRAVSAFYHHFRRARVQADSRLAAFGPQYGIVDIGFYARHWRNWTRHFGEAAPIVVLFDSIARDPNAVVTELWRRLGLAAGSPAPVGADHAGFRLRIRDNALEIDIEAAENQALAERWSCDIAAAPRVHADDLALLNEVFRDDIAFCQARWGDAAGVDWTRPRRLEDMLTGR